MYCTQIMHVCLDNINFHVCFNRQFHALPFGPYYTVTCVYTHNNNNNIWCTFDDSTALRVYTVEQQLYVEEYIKKCNKKKNHILLT